MRRLFALIVITFAILAGFGARADSTNEWQVYYDTHPSIKLIHCSTKTRIYTDYDSKLVGVHKYSTKIHCNTSDEFDKLKIKYEGKKNKPNKPVKPSKPKGPKYPVIAKYVKIFEQKTEIKVDLNKITLGKTPKGSVGVCSMGTRSIVINKTYWESAASEYDREMTIYHELGHCILNRGHFNVKNKTFYSPTLQKNCPRSIMYKDSYTAKDAYRCFHEHRNFYWKELKAGSYSVRAFKIDANGKEKQLFGYHLSHGLNTDRVGPFTCKTRLGDPLVSDGIYEIFLAISIECTRDNVIFFKANGWGGQAKGDDIIKNIEIRALNTVLPELHLRDTILNESFRIRIYKLSLDLI